MKNGSMETDGSTNRSITHSIHFFLLSDLSCKFVILNSIFLQFFNNGDLIRRCCSSDCGMFLSSFVDLIGWICFNFTCCSRHRFHESQQIGLIHRNSMILNGRINQLPSYSYRLWFTGGKRARSKKEKKAFSDRSMPSVYKTSGGGTCNAVLFKSSGDPEIQSSSHRHDSLIKWFTNKKRPRSFARCDWDIWSEGQHVTLRINLEVSIIIFSQLWHQIDPWLFI